jgi:hypothetical protein
MGINFGAPGDRKDSSGREWFGYPRPSTRDRLEYVFDIEHSIAPGGGWYSRNEQSLDVGGTDSPWLYASGGRGLTRFELPLIGEGQPPATYTVRLHFAVLDDEPTGKFDVRLQGRKVATDVDVGAKAGSHHAHIEEFGDIEVNANLLVELVPESNRSPTALAAVEVIRQD